MSYAFQQDVVLLLSPILHRMLRFANLHPECRNKYRRAAVLPSLEGLQLNTASPLPGSAVLDPATKSVLQKPKATAKAV